jgi:L-threonylcarbamoyladenylate synthase
MHNQILKAAEIINQGGIIIFPTDTAYGIGCRIDNEKAVKKLFKLRNRPESQASPVLVDGLSQAQKYLQPIKSSVINKLINKYWPGALTIILPCKNDMIPSLVRGGTNTLGVREPDHPICKKLIEKVGYPILGPSANFHGEKTPFSFQELDKSLIKLVDFVIKGKCALKQASTVIDCSIEPWQVLRKGAININLN